MTELPRPVSPEPAKSTSGVTIGGRHFSGGLIAAIVVATVVIAGSFSGVGGGNDGGSGGMNLGEAFCSDLRSGASVFQIISSAPDSFDASDDGIPARVFVWAERECPDELGTNVGLRGYLDANGLDPDD
jgi:hypothetical protein